MTTIQQARAIVGKQLGLKNFDGSAASYGALNQGDQIRLTNALFSYIDQNPVQFTQDQVTLARNVIARGGNIGDVQDAGFDWSMFGNELVNNARKINPLDPQNIGAVGTRLLIAAVVLGSVWLFLNRKKG